MPFLDISLKLIRIQINNIRYFREFWNSRRKAIAPTTNARNQISEVLVKCMSDPAYKADLIEDPKNVLAEMGIRIPEQTRLVVAETESMFSIQRVAGDIVKIVLPSSF